MNSLFAFIFMFSFVAIVIGVVNPPLVLIKRESHVKRNRKNAVIIYGGILLSSFILFVATMPEPKTAAASLETINPEVKADSKTVPKKADSKLKQASKKDASLQTTVPSRKTGLESFETGITYVQLASTPDEFKGKKAAFCGSVLEIVKKEQTTLLTLAVDGNPDTLLLVEYKNDILPVGVLQNYSVTVGGISNGLVSHKNFPSLHGSAIYCH